MLRPVRLIITWLLVGLFLTGAVSWLIAAFRPQTGWTACILLEDSPPDEDGLSIDEYRATGAIRRVWERMSPATDRMPPFFDAIRDSRMADEVQFCPSGPISWPDWGRSTSVRKAITRSPWDGLEHATGWPLVALWYEVISPASTPYQFQVEGGIPLSRSTPSARPPIADLRALPWRPIWIALVIDSVFWGLVALGASRVLVAGRQARRLRRHLCPRCAYSLAGQPAPGCPECGWKRNLASTPTVSE